MKNSPSLDPAERDALLGLFFALIAAVGFSAKAILVKLAYREGVDAVTLLALRMAFSVPFLAGTALWTLRQHPDPIDARDWGLVALLGVIG